MTKPVLVAVSFAVVDVASFLGSQGVACLAVLVPWTAKLPFLALGSAVAGLSAFAALRAMKGARGDYSCGRREVVAWVTLSLVAALNAWSLWSYTFSGSACPWGFGA